MLEVAEALGKQACTDQQYQGKCGLKHDERFLRKRCLIARGAVDAVQGLRRIGVGGDPSRDDSEQDSGEQRQNKGEAQNDQRWGGVDGRLRRVREGESENHPGTSVGHSDANDSARATQQQTFDQHLSDQAGSGRAQGHANRSFSATGRTPRQKKIGDIGAGYEQNKA